MFCASCRGIFPIEATVCDRDGSPLERAEQVLAGAMCQKCPRIGEHGHVYRATQLPMGREVAVKLMHSDLVRNPDLVARFEREAQAASTVDHPNAITVYDSGKSPDGQVYIAMEFLDGETLSAVIERENRLPPDRALELWIPAVKAMVVAHRRGVIHRDPKPDNILRRGGCRTMGRRKKSSRCSTLASRSFAKVASGRARRWWGRGLARRCTCRPSSREDARRVRARMSMRWGLC